MYASEHVEIYDNLVLKKQLAFFSYRHSLVRLSMMDDVIGKKKSYFVKSDKNKFKWSLYESVMFMK